jgi:hypothetical protein
MIGTIIVFAAFFFYPLQSPLSAREREREREKDDNGIIASAASVHWVWVKGCMDFPIPYSLVPEALTW